MKKLIVANFKMNPSTASEFSDLLRTYGEKSASMANVDFVAAPPFVFLFQVMNSQTLAASQNCFYEDFGAYTGEISPLMLKNLGVRYAIIGHSERRKMGETDEVINKKVQAAKRNGLIPILCVGETLEEKESGKKEEAVRHQIAEALKNGEWEGETELIIAYEPVWAIGTGLACDPNEASQMTEVILDEVKKIIAGVKIIVIYGGSVDANNIKGFLEKPNIFGALVGGASLKKEEFVKILEIANSI